MKIINLQIFYPDQYEKKKLEPVSDKVAKVLFQSLTDEDTYERIQRRYQANGHLGNDEFIANFCYDRSTMFKSLEDELDELSERLVCEKDFEEKLEAVYRAIDQLTDRQRSRLDDYFFKGMNYRQIARKDRVHESSVRESIQKTIEKIRKTLAK